LKPYETGGCGTEYASLNHNSIKTRIETIFCLLNACQRRVVWITIPLKQGLKQQGVYGFTRSGVIVWITIPLKQGLKHWQQYLSQLSQLVWITIPLKQGLKLSIYKITTVTGVVWITIPLKQGLKQNQEALEKSEIGVWITIPLKQGLKPEGVSDAQPDYESLNHNSIKTRIETSTHCFSHLLHAMSESQFH